MSSSLSIAQEIQLSLAPVFLLTAIAGLLSFLMARISRLSDRLRALSATGEAEATDMRDLLRRLRLNRLAINANLLSGCLVCCVIVLIYLSDYMAHDTSLIIAGLFVGAVLLLVFGFACIMLEIGTAARRAATAPCD